MHDITFDDVSFVNDFGVTIESVKVGSPVPRKAEITVPFRSSTIDMDKVTGYATYDDRTITVKVWKKCSNYSSMREWQTIIEKSLFLSTEKKELFDSAEEFSGQRKYSYMAFCNGLDFSESKGKTLHATITFKADPYRRLYVNGVFREEVI